MNYPRIVLKSGRDQSLKRRHPWIFSGAIKHKEEGIEEGDVVEVRDNNDEFLALGHFQIGSIAIRVLSFSKSEINSDFWNSKILDAVSYRQNTGIYGSTETNVFRLIHGEGDGLPGLIIDYYNGTVVTQMHSIGMYLEKDSIVNALKEVLEEKLVAVFDKSETTLPFKAKIKPANGYLFGEKGESVVKEYGNLFQVDWVEGQKTGFFIDQRENRNLLKSFCKDKVVLNAFGYTGGFSVYALQGGAKMVDTVDSSKRAIELAMINIEKNFPGCLTHNAIEADVFEFLSERKNEYDVIVLDPPAFAKHNESLENALKAYKRINEKAIRQILPGGIIFTFSCSQVVTREDFRKSVFAAAASSGRHVRILYQLTQPHDHPVSIFHPEGEYLKGLVLYIS